MRGAYIRRVEKAAFHVQRSMCIMRVLETGKCVECTSVASKKQHSMFIVRVLETLKCVERTFGE